MTTGAASANVKSWDAETGTGVLDSPQTPGGCWFHWSAVEQPAYGPLLSFAVGEQVLLEWEQIPAGTQDGFRFRATRVRSKPCASR